MDKVMYRAGKALGFIIGYPIGVVLGMIGRINH